MRKLENLPPYEQVFFTHYETTGWDSGNEITSLGIYSEGIAHIFDTGIESENINSFTVLSNELVSSGQLLVHWNQNSSLFGPIHIKKRYKELTNKDLILDYNKSINLSDWFIRKYGNDYIDHPRLDSLAKLNRFSGIRSEELGLISYPKNRLLLLTKIYWNELAGSLKLGKGNKQLKKPLWLKLGISMASGDFFNIYDNCEGNATQTAKMMDNIRFREYILATMNDYQEANRDKNLIRNPNKILQIMEYCQENDIKICSKFQDLINVVGK